MRLFRREWVVPALALAFVSASAQASRDALSAQAAEEMRCNSVTVIQSSANEYLASGCGKDWAYTCGDDDTCSSDQAMTPGRSTSPEDDEAAEAVASALTDMACACASAGLAHGSHHSHSRSSGTHTPHKRR